MQKPIAERKVSYRPTIPNEQLKRLGEAAARRPYILGEAATLLYLIESDAIIRGLVEKGRTGRHQLTREDLLALFSEIAEVMDGVPVKDALR